MQEAQGVTPERDEAKRKIRAAGLRATTPRLAVLQLLVAEARPLSHTEVVERLHDSDADPATLYRNLIRLEQVKLIQVVSRVGGIARYTAVLDAQDTHLHPHFSCQSCGAVDCLPGLRINLPVDAAWQLAVREAELQVVGTCPSCRA